MKLFKEYFLYAFDFVGVCNRKDFWITFACVIVMYAVSIGLLFLGVVGQLISILIGLVLFVPTVSLIVRRLHDTDRSAKNLLWWLFPFVGALIVFIMLTEKTRYVIPEK